MYNFANNILHSIARMTSCFHLFLHGVSLYHPPPCTLVIYTSVKIIQLNEYGCRDAPCEKSWKQGNPLSNTIKDTSTIMRNPLSELCREGYA